MSKENVRSSHYFFQPFSRSVVMVTEAFILAYALINQQSWRNEDSNNFVISRLPLIPRTIRANVPISFWDSL